MQQRNHLLRPAALLLALCLLASLLPARPAKAVTTAATSAMEQLRGWGVLKGYPDGDMRPDQPVTRAEFIAMLNRAYGFNDDSDPKKFNDVPEDAWYASDIAIASTAGYFQGTSNNTASPDTVLSREDSILLLAQCMRMDPLPGEATEFTDGRSLGQWSRGYVKAAAQKGIVTGYSDGSFHPKSPITRGEMSQLLVRALGTLVTENGTQVLGDVYGSVTVSRPGTILKDTTIVGDLYITGGLGLGAVTLDNVSVSGKIIVAGCGASEAGDDSVILRNVEAAGLQVDSTNGQYISLRTEGDTSVKDAVLRTDAYVQDRTDAGYGLLTLTLDGRSENAAFTLAGNLKDVVNKTADSSLYLTSGAARSVTIDEVALNSVLNIDNDATVRQLNLDIAAQVTGTGDIDRIMVGANGSKVAMLPDKIDVRPGVSATISGTQMNTQTGLQASEDPKLLAGYPVMRNVAPTSAQAIFSSNKTGTVYWAVSTVSDGSVAVEDLISPPAYGSKAVRHGSVSTKNADTEFSASISNLAKGGSYYLSAVMVDARNTRSPLKVTSFSTPDDTKPDFSTGFPVMSKITNNAAQVGAMTTKDCILYYALLPKGAVAPTADDFKADAVSGSIGFGHREMSKSIAEYFYVNEHELDEQVSYDLYLWLTDADGSKSSEVVKLSFTTVDGTPPVFTTDLTFLSAKPTSITCSAAINENGTIYWVAVPARSEYPKPMSGSTEKPALTSHEAKLAVANGKGIGANGKNGRTNAKENVDTTFNLSGLKSESAYDIYYVAQDSAGNFSDVVKVLADVHTQDDTAPTVWQRFSHTSDTDTSMPYADTNIDIVFSETVRENAAPSEALLELYNNVISAPTIAEEEAARTALAAVLRRTIRLYSSNSHDPVPEREVQEGEQDNDWVIDYRNAEVFMDETDAEGRRLVVRFYGKDEGIHLQSLKLKSGSTYHFRVEGLADTSDSKNLMRGVNLANFTTVSAQAVLKALNLVNDVKTDGGTMKAEDIDLAFSMTPLSASTVEDTMNWDLLLWFNTTVTFELYYQEPGTDYYIQAEESGQIYSANGDYKGVSLYRTLRDQPSNPLLNQLEDEEDYHFIVHFTRLGDSPEEERSSWTGDIRFRAQVVSGSDLNLGTQAGSLNSYALSEGIVDLSSPKDFSMRKLFTDKTEPYFNTGFPKINKVTDRSAQVEVQLNRPGTIYYVVAPVGDIRTWDLPLGAGEPSDVSYDNGRIPETVGGVLVPNDEPFLLTEPSNIAITEPTYTTGGDSNIIVGKPKSVQRNTDYINLEGLLPNTQYFLYVVLQGAQGGAMSPHTMLYKFTTAEEDPFVVELEMSNPIVSIVPTQNAVVDYVLLRWEKNSLDARLTSPISEHFANTDQDTSNIPSTMTVLESMNADVSENGVSQGSVFDLYADPTFKMEMAGYIASQQAGSSPNIVGSDRNVQINIDRTPRYQVDCSKMDLSPGVEYVFLVAGRVAGDPNSSYAFRAISPIFISDSNPPKVTGIDLTPLSDDASAYDITVSFDEYLYYYDTNTDPATKRGIDQGPVERAWVPTDFVSIRYMVQTMTPTLEFVTSDEQIGQNTTTFTLRTWSMNDGSIVIFKPNIADEYGNNRRTPPLRITFEYVVDKNGTGHYEAKIPREWDGTAKHEYS